MSCECMNPNRINPIQMMFNPFIGPPNQNVMNNFHPIPRFQRPPMVHPGYQPRA